MEHTLTEVFWQMSLEIDPNKTLSLRQNEFFHLVFGQRQATTC